MNLDKEKGEFNFLMHQNETHDVLYQARYLGPESEAVKGLAYNIVQETRLTHRQKKRINKIMRLTSKACAEKLCIQGLGTLRDYG